jgi:hypothetical protein
MNWHVAGTFVNASVAASAGTAVQPEKSMYSSFLQLLNALFAIDVTDGITTYFNALQLFRKYAGTVCSTWNDALSRPQAVDNE